MDTEVPKTLDVPNASDASGVPDVPDVPDVHSSDESDESDESDKSDVDMCNLLATTEALESRLGPEYSEELKTLKEKILTDIKNKILKDIEDKLKEIKCEDVDADLAHKKIDILINFLVDFETESVVNNQRTNLMHAYCKIKIDNLKAKVKELEKNYEKLTNNEFSSISTLNIDNLIDNTDSELPDPIRQTKRSAGYDIYATESIEILPGDTAQIKTNARLSPKVNNLATNIMCKIMGRSSFKGLVIEGLIDQDYDKTIIMKVFNNKKETLVINRADRIGQVYLTFALTGTADFIDRKRVGGFGSTTKRDN